MDQTTEVYAFTSRYDDISMKLISSATLTCNDKVYDTDRVLWDTGSTMSCISQNVVEMLDLAPVDQTPFFTSGGESSTDMYMIDIKLQDDTIYLKNIYVLKADIDPQGLDVLIGMDIITRGDFTVSNYNGKTMFSFRMPSLGYTDYMESVIPYNGEKSVD